MEDISSELHLNNSSTNSHKVTYHTTFWRDVGKLYYEVQISLGKIIK